MSLNSWDISLVHLHLENEGKSPNSSLEFLLSRKHKCFQVKEGLLWSSFCGLLWELECPTWEGGLWIHGSLVSLGNPPIIATEQAYPFNTNLFFKLKPAGHRERSKWWQSVFVADLKSLRILFRTFYPWYKCKLFSSCYILYLNLQNHSIPECAHKLKIQLRI